MIGNDWSFIRNLEVAESGILVGSEKFFSKLALSDYK